MIATDALLAGVHRGPDELPWADMAAGSKMRIAYANRGQGIWIVQNVFQRGFEAPTHQHTGPVWGCTMAGAWRYKEYDYVNVGGSFLYEPAGSVHTLECIEDGTLAWFHMCGSNLDLDSDGQVTNVVNGPKALEGYYELCEAQGLARPNVIVE
jgi:quercetin dioxygenase-like cupin family protein